MQDPSKAMQLRINNYHGFHGVQFDNQQNEEDENLLKVIPQVTVVLEGSDNSTSKEEQLILLLVLFLILEELKFGRIIPVKAKSRRGRGG
ncbi:hypothetical protein MKW94_029449 [Papaver nudicaule]|uniref:Uncharacterized protein n=1 Tax=Papaver nudicaule TaxID=74823 RepID=A0AA41S6X4_PAPNU|nr:hypothetical protein [Papaver nudicaule]